MQVDRKHHVFGRHRLAVVEFHALPQLEDPPCQIVAGVPFGRKFGNQRPVRPDLDQAVAQLILHMHAKTGFIDLRVQGVGRVEVIDRKAEGPPLARGLLRQNRRSRQP